MGFGYFVNFALMVQVFRLLVFREFCIMVQVFRLLVFREYCIMVQVFRRGDLWSPEIMRFVLSSAFCIMVRANTVRP